MTRDAPVLLLTVLAAAPSPQRSRLSRRRAGAGAPPSRNRSPRGGAAAPRARPRRRPCRAPATISGEVAPPGPRRWCCSHRRRRRPRASRSTRSTPCSRSSSRRRCGSTAPTRSTRARSPSSKGSRPARGRRRVVRCPLERVLDALEPPLAHRDDVEADLEPSSSGRVASHAAAARRTRRCFSAVTISSGSPQPDAASSPSPRRSGAAAAARDQVELVAAGPDVRAEDRPAAQPVEPGRAALGGYAGTGASPW